MNLGKFKCAYVYTYWRFEFIGCTHFLKSVSSNCRCLDSVTFHLKVGKKISFPDRESNPGRGGESAES